jgi:hypothetical protein
MFVAMSEIVLPILHQIQASIAALDRKVSALRRDIGDARVTERKVTNLHEDVNRVAERMQDLEIRVEKLEVVAVRAD